VLLREGVMSQEAADALYADIAERQGLEIVQLTKTETKTETLT